MIADDTLSALNMRMINDKCNARRMIAAFAYYPSSFSLIEKRAQNYTYKYPPQTPRALPPTPTPLVAS